MTRKLIFLIMTAMVLQSVGCMEKKKPDEQIASTAKSFETTKKNA